MLRLVKHFMGGREHVQGVVRVFCFTPVCTVFLCFLLSFVVFLMYARSSSSNG